MNKMYTVLDKGFVEVIEYTQKGDSLAEKAARMSFGSPRDNPENQVNGDFIKTLIKNGHTSPFEHISITMLIKAPIFVARQLMRHRIASINENSLRYTIAAPEFYEPTENRLGKLEKNVELLTSLREVNTAAVGVYNNMIKNNVSKEIARLALPVGLYTTWLWSLNARSMMNVLALRLENHSQYETRQYAKAINSIFQDVFPASHKGFMETLDKTKYTILMEVPDNG